MIVDGVEITDILIEDLLQMTDGVVELEADPEIVADHPEVPMVAMTPEEIVDKMLLAKCKREEKEYQPDAMTMTDMSCLIISLSLLVFSTCIDLNSSQGESVVIPPHL
jgi:hypothetical protein